VGGDPLREASPYPYLNLQSLFFYSFFNIKTWENFSNTIAKLVELTLGKK
jgi:hypothetical protein